MNSIKEFEDSLLHLDLTKIETITNLITDIEQQVNNDIYIDGDAELDIKTRIRRIFMIKLLKTLKRLVNQHKYLLQ